MNEVLQEELKSSVGKEITIFLKNNFRYSGRVLNIDDVFVKINDRKVGILFVRLDDISSIIRRDDDRK